MVEHKPLYLQGKDPPAPIYTRRTEEFRLDHLDAINLSYHYPDTGRGIEGINLHLKRGSLTVITGRVGSGKTTCIRVLLGLLPKDQGVINRNGQEVEDPASFFVPPHSEYVAQVPHLFSDTLRKNILLGLPENDVDISHALKLAAFEHDVETLEHQLDTMIGIGGLKLSGGQAKRAAAARMCVCDAELLVINDLSSALDVETEKAMWKRVFTSSEPHTYLVVSHSRKALRRSSQ